MKSKTLVIPCNAAAVAQNSELFPYSPSNPKIAKTIQNAGSTFKNQHQVNSNEEMQNQGEYLA